MASERCSTGGTWRPLERLDGPQSWKTMRLYQEKNPLSRVNSLFWNCLPSKDSTKTVGVTLAPLKNHVPMGKNIRSRVVFQVPGTWFQKKGGHEKRDPFFLGGIKRHANAVVNFTRFPLSKSVLFRFICHIITRCSTTTPPLLPPTNCLFLPCWQSFFWGRPFSLAGMRCLGSNKFPLGSPGWSEGEQT